MGALAKSHEIWFNPALDMHESGDAIAGCLTGRSA